MGVIWNTMRFARVPQQTLMLQEERGTLSRRWPLLWHFWQYWHLLKVVAVNPRQPYYVYRLIEGGKITRYHLLVHTPHVMVQVGPEKTYYWAETRTHQPLPLTATGIKKADILTPIKPRGVHALLKKHFYTKT